MGESQNPVLPGEFAPDGRRKIEWKPGELPAIIDQAEAALIEASGDPVIYQRGGVLVRIVRRAPTSARRMSRAAGGLCIVALDVAGLVDMLTKHAEWYRPIRDKDTGEWRDKPLNCPHEVAAVLLARNQWRFPPLTGLIEAPTLRPDGSLLDVPGYDPKTGLYYDPGACEFEPIHRDDDRDTAIARLEDLVDMLEEFPFASDIDLSVAVAAILTALVRPSLAGAPLFGFKAQVMGSGKTYLAHAVSLVAQGRQAAVIAPPRDAKEEDKTLFAALLEADPVLVYDNVEHQLASDMLCAILTSETLRGRVLGTSKTAAVSTACVFIATGNNLVIAGDLSARALVCTLKPKEAHPEHRRFVTDLTTWIPDHRGHLVSSALSFLCAFLASGAKPDMEPWQRFPDWDRLIRASLIWAGLPDPLSALRNAEQQDPRRLEHAAVMAAWALHREDLRQRGLGDEIPARELKRLADDLAMVDRADANVLKDALVEIAGDRGEINLRRLGIWLGKVAGRQQVVNNETGASMMIERGRARAGSQNWRLIEVSQ